MLLQEPFACRSGSTRRSVTRRTNQSLTAFHTATEQPLIRRQRLRGHIIQQAGTLTETDTFRNITNPCPRTGSSTTNHTLRTTSTSNRPAHEPDAGSINQTGSSQHLTFRSRQSKLAFTGDTTNLARQTGHQLLCRRTRQTASQSQPARATSQRTRTKRHIRFWCRQRIRHRFQHHTGSFLRNIRHKVSDLPRNSLALLTDKHLPVTNNLINKRIPNRIRQLFIASPIINPIIPTSVLIRVKNIADFLGRTSNTTTNLTQRITIRRRDGLHHRFKNAFPQRLLRRLTRSQPLRLQHCSRTDLRIGGYTGSKTTLQISNRLTNLLLTCNTGRHTSLTTLPHRIHKRREINLILHRLCRRHNRTGRNRQTTRDRHLLHGLLTRPRSRTNLNTSQPRNIGRKILTG